MKALCATFSVLFALIVPLVASAEEPIKPDPVPAHPPAAEPPPSLKQYFFVMLMKGDKRDQDAETAKQLQAGHMAHMARNAASGKLMIAGPFGDDGDWRGILIYDVPDVDAAKALCAADPAVAAGRLKCEIHPWWSQPGSTLK